MNNATDIWDGFIIRAHPSPQEPVFFPGETTLYYVDFLPPRVMVELVPGEPLPPATKDNCVRVGVDGDGKMEVRGYTDPDEEFAYIPKEEFVRKAFQKVQDMLDGKPDDYDPDARYSWI